MENGNNIREENSLFKVLKGGGVGAPQLLRCGISKYTFDKMGKKIFFLFFSFFLFADTSVWNVMRNLRERCGRVWMRDKMRP